MFKLKHIILIALFFTRNAFAFTVHRCRVDYEFDHIGSWRTGILAEKVPSAIEVYRGMMGQHDTYIWASVSHDGTSFRAILKGKGVKPNEVWPEGRFLRFQSKNGFISGILSCQKQSENVPVLFRNNFDGNIFAIQKPKSKDTAKSKFYQLYYQHICYIGDINAARSALLYLKNWGYVKDAQMNGEEIKLSYTDKTCVSTTPPAYYGDSYCGDWKTTTRYQTIGPCRADWNPVQLVAQPEPVRP